MLAFDSGIDWDIERVQGASGMMGGGLYNMPLKGTGWVAILSDGPPVLLNVASAPTFADAQAAITWSSGVTTSMKTDFKVKNLIGKGSGESVQLAFPGQGWVLVQPSEGRVTVTGARVAAAAPAGRWATSWAADRGRGTGGESRTGASDWRYARVRRTGAGLSRRSDRQPHRRSSPAPGARARARAVRPLHFLKLALP